VVKEVDEKEVDITGLQEVVKEVNEKAVVPVGYSNGEQNPSVDVVKEVDTVDAEIDKVTVDTLPEIFPKLKKYGWAILRDCNKAFAPKSRFTRDQMEYINQCTSTMYSFIHVMCRVIEIHLCP